jgi:hypothetical protein
VPAASISALRNCLLPACVGHDGALPAANSEQRAVARSAPKSIKVGTIKWPNRHLNRCNLQTMGAIRMTTTPALLGDGCHIIRARSWRPRRTGSAPSVRLPIVTDFTLKTGAFRGAGQSSHRSPAITGLRRHPYPDFHFNHIARLQRTNPGAPVEMISPCNSA